MNDPCHNLFQSKDIQKRWNYIGPQTLNQNVINLQDNAKKLSKFESPAPRREGKDLFRNERLIYTNPKKQPSPNQFRVYESKIQSDYDQYMNSNVSILQSFKHCVERMNKSVDRKLRLSELLQKQQYNSELKKLQYMFEDLKKNIQQLLQQEANNQEEKKFLEQKLIEFQVQRGFQNKETSQLDAQVSSELNSIKKTISELELKHNEAQLQTQRSQKIEFEKLKTQFDQNYNNLNQKLSNLQNEIKPQIQKKDVEQIVSDQMKSLKQQILQQQNQKNQEHINQVDKTLQLFKANLENQQKQIFDWEKYNKYQLNEQEQNLMKDQLNILSQKFQSLEQTKIKEVDEKLLKFKNDALDGQERLKNELNQQMNEKLSQQFKQIDLQKMITELNVEMKQFQEQILQIKPCLNQYEEQKRKLQNLENTVATYQQELLILQQKQEITEKNNTQNMEGVMAQISKQHQQSNTGQILQQFDGNTKSINRLEQQLSLQGTTLKNIEELSQQIQQQQIQLNSDQQNYANQIKPLVEQNKNILNEQNQLRIMIQDSNNKLLQLDQKQTQNEKQIILLGEQNVQSALQINKIVQEMQLQIQNLLNQQKQEQIQKQNQEEKQAIKQEEPIIEQQDIGYQNLDQERLKMVQEKINDIYNQSCRKRGVSGEFQKFLRDEQNINELYRNYSIRSSEVKKQLKQVCNGFRQARGDGNCFYTAFGFQFFNILLNKYQQMEYQQFIDSMDKIITFKINYGQNSIENQELEQQCWNELKYRLQYLRNLESNVRQQEFLKHFSAYEQEYDKIDGCFYGLSTIFFRNIANYVVENSEWKTAVYDQQTLLNWEEECNNNEIVIQLLSQFLKVFIKLLFFENGGFQIRQYSEDQPHQIILLITPGHYNVGINKIVEQEEQEEQS